MTVKNNNTLLSVVAAAVFLYAAAIADASLLCAHSEYPKVCENIVQGQTNAAEAARATIEKLLRKSTDAKAFTLTIEHVADKFGKLLLESCKDTYDDAISSLKTSLDLLKTGDKADLNVNLSAALSDYVTCDDGFLGEEDSPLGNGAGHVNPLGDLNTRLVKIASVALSLTN